jgi:carbonic anhydrase
MTRLAPLLDRNRAFAATRRHEGLSPLPRHGVLVVGCIDSRVDPAALLGLELGEALVLRNSGGRVTPEVVEEVVLVAQMSETMAGGDAPEFEVAVVHHTACGTGMLADDGFRHAFAARVGADAAALAELAVTDPAATVAADVHRLRSSSLLPAQVTVSGHVYDVATGLVRTIVPAGPAAAGAEAVG